jgi:hypothetical protein
MLRNEGGRQAQLGIVWTGVKRPGALEKAPENSEEYQNIDFFWGYFDNVFSVCIVSNDMKQ